MMSARSMLPHQSSIMAKNPEPREVFMAIAMETFDRLQRIVPNVLDIDARDSCKRTPLLAAMNVTDKTVLLHMARLLLRHGCDVNAQDQNGRTPTMLACMDKEKMDVLELLTKNSACDVGLKDRDGNTALHHAVENGNAAAIRLLLNSPAGKNTLNVNETNNAGLSPYRLALKLQHVRCSRMLVKHCGADLVKNPDDEADKNGTSAGGSSANKSAAPRTAKSSIRESLLAMINERTTKGAPADSLTRAAPPNSEPVAVETRAAFKSRPKSEVLPFAAIANPYRPLSDRRVVALARDIREPIARPESRSRFKEGSFLNVSSETTSLSGSGGTFVNNRVKPTQISVGATAFINKPYQPGGRLIRADTTLRRPDVPSAVNSRSHTDEDTPGPGGKPHGSEYSGSNNYSELRRKQGLNVRRVLTPITQKVYVEETRPITPVPKGRLPSIASGKRFYLVTPRETPNELF